jgi:hypothetical protein
VKTSTAAVVLLAASLAACEGPQTDRQSLRGVERAEASVPQPKPQTKTQPNTQVTAAPPALIQGAPIAASDLMPRLEEAGGSVVLEEMTLSRLLDKAIADSGIAVPQHDIDAEQQLFVQTMAEEAKLTPEQAQAMLNDIRKSRGLGPTRFADLLARNAKLRALVRPDVEVSAEEVEQSLAAEFGPKARIRIITAPTERAVAEVRAEITKDFTPLLPREAPAVGPALPEGPKDPMLTSSEFAMTDAPAVSLRFAQAALEHSTDPSAPRGGLIAAISPVDPGLPLSARRALAQMKPGELSGVLTTDRGAMLLLYESLTEAQGTPTPQDRAHAEARVRSRKERIAMDRLARQLLGTANVSPLDQSLRWSWETRVK